jgi:hypothetical protein
MKDVLTELKIFLTTKYGHLTGIIVFILLICLWEFVVKPILRSIFDLKKSGLAIKKYK